MLSDGEGVSVTARPPPPALGEVDKWIRRRICAVAWRQWRISMSPALSIALPNASLAKLGLAPCSSIQ